MTTTRKERRHARRSRRTRLTIAFASLVLFAAPLATTQWSPADAASTTTFHVDCPRVYSLHDDPIVFPNQPGASHFHDFYGNKTTNAFSTTESLLAGATTCTDPGDRAAYWQPALYVNGVQQVPKYVKAYYAGGVATRPYPLGLRIIAGDARATGPQPLSVTSWACASANGDQFTYVPQCSSGDHIRARINFPQCWDGARLDSADHKSHLTYATSNTVCPASHPVLVPQLTLRIAFYVAPNPATVTLSSGPAYTFHADFFNAWEPAELQALTSQCLNTLADCGKITARRATGTTTTTTTTLPPVTTTTTLPPPPPSTTTTTTTVPCAA
jgi:hypothetical protein